MESSDNDPMAWPSPAQLVKDTPGMGCIMVEGLPMVFLCRGPFATIEEFKDELNNFANDVEWIEPGMQLNFFWLNLDGEPVSGSTLVWTVTQTN